MSTTPYRHPIFLLLITLLVIAIYAPALNGGFYHDDTTNLVYNEKLRIESLDLKSLKSAATSSSAGTLLRPISMGSFALNYYFFGDEPLSFKLTNVILHLLNGMLIFAIALKLFSLTSNKQNLSSAYKFAVVVSLVWLVHPLHVSTVAYIVQRMAILSTLFSLLAILFYILARTRIIYNQKYAASILFLCPLSIFLGLYSKENAALTPVFILLLETTIFFPLSKSTTYKRHTKNILIGLAVFTVAFSLFFKTEIYEYISHWYYTTREFSISERLYTQARVVIYYIKWLLLPNIQELGLFHDDIPLSKSIFSPISTFICMIIICGLIITAAIIRKKYAIVALGIGWFFIGHLLESTIIPLEMIYEHRNYLPSVGLLLAISDISIRTIRIQPKLSKHAFNIAIVVVVIFSLITMLRASQWSDTISFAYYEAQHHPESLRATHALGLEYKGLVESGEIQHKAAAFEYLSRASKLGEKRLFSEVALLQLSAALDEPANPEWIDRMATKLSTPVLRIDDLILLGDSTSCDNEKCLLPREAAIILFDATKSNSRLSLSPRNHAKFHTAYAKFILQRGGNAKQAEASYVNAIQLMPNDIQNYVDYINLLIAMGRANDAVEYLNQAKQRNRFYENIPLLDDLEKYINKAIQDASQDQ